MGAFACGKRRQAVSGDRPAVCVWNSLKSPVSLKAKTWRWTVEYSFAPCVCILRLLSYPAVFFCLKQILNVTTYLSERCGVISKPENRCHTFALILHGFRQIYAMISYAQ